MFEQEAAGLVALTQAAALRVPAVVTSGPLDEQHDCLVLEAIESASPAGNFWEQFGHGLANLHRATTATNFGWSGDNFLGSNVQRNAPTGNWVEFYKLYHLLNHLNLFGRGYLDSCLEIARRFAG